MNELFYLPMSYSDVAELTVNLSNKEIKAVQEAINHVDLLADALEALLEAITNKGSQDSINNQVISAAFTLAAYRSGK